MEPASNWLNSDALNLQKIRDSQQADPVLSTVFDWVDRGVRPTLSSLSAEGKEIKYLWGQFPSLEISSGILVRRLINAGMSPKVQILIPGELRETVLEECHASPTAGHLRWSKILSNVKKRFLWIGMRHDVEIYMKTCTVCQQYKSPGQSRKAALKDYRKREPLGRICIDLAGPFPVLGRGNRYALVVTVSQSMWRSTPFLRQ